MLILLKWGEGGKLVFLIGTMEQSSRYLLSGLCDLLGNDMLSYCMPLEICVKLSQLPDSPLERHPQL